MKPIKLNPTPKKTSKKSKSNILKPIPLPINKIIIIPNHNSKFKLFSQGRLIKNDLIIPYTIIAIKDGFATLQLKVA